MHAFANGIVNHEQCAMRIVDIGGQTKEEKRFFICSGPTRSSFRDALTLLDFPFAASLLSHQSTVLFRLPKPHPQCHLLPPSRSYC